MKKTFLETIHEQDEFRFWHFPATERSIFCAHSSTSPLPRHVAEKLVAYAETYTTEWQSADAIVAEAESVRDRVADFLGIDRAGVAFVGSTALGLGAIAESLTWRSGDRILLMQYDFPANIQPWRNLERKGVTIDFVPMEEDHRLTWARIEACLTPQTRLVSFSAVHYLTGHRPHMEGIARGLRERGVLVCVDAIQALGAVRCDLTHVDFLAAGGHKWLMSPKGSGILYINPEKLHLLSPAPLGWLSVADRDNYIDPGTEPLPNAQRFELGTTAMPCIHALGAAIDLFQRADPVQTEAHIRALHSRILEHAALRSFSPIGYHGDGETSGIVSLCLPEVDVPALQRGLLAGDFGGRNAVATVRPDWYGRPLLRIAPHLCTPLEDIDAFFDALDFVRQRVGS